MSISNAPVRGLKKSYRTVTGRFFSRKLSRLVQFDSMLEHDFILLLDLHPAVQTFVEQPMAIAWIDDCGERQVYVPDFYVTFRAGSFLGRRVDKSWIVETKYRTDLLESWHRIRPKLKAGFAPSRFIECCREARVEYPALNRNAISVRQYLDATVSAYALVEAVPKKPAQIASGTPRTTRRTG